MAALAAQTGVGNASTFVGRVPATIIGAPSAWGLTAESAFVLAFAGGDLPQPAAAFAVYTNVRAVVASVAAGLSHAWACVGVARRDLLGARCWGRARGQRQSVA